LAKEALVWFKKYPDDPHDADVLGFAVRVVRNGCRSEATDELNHQLLDILHRRFPKSEWPSGIPPGSETVAVDAPMRVV